MWWVNSSPPSTTYMHEWAGSALVQVMACHLFGAKLSPEPVLDYCQLDFWDQISVKFESEFYYFQSRKCIWNCHLPKWRPFCPGGDDLNCCDFVAHRWHQNLIITGMFIRLITITITKSFSSSPSPSRTYRGPHGAHGSKKLHQKKLPVVQCS